MSLHQRKFALHQLSRENKRIDFEWLDPKHKDMIKVIHSIAEEKKYVIKPLSYICDYFNGKTGDQYVSAGIPILKVRNITGEGIDWDTDFVLRDFYESNPEIHHYLNRRGNDR